LSNDLQTSSARAVAYGQVGGANGDCFLVSAQYQTKPTSGSGDVFAAAMGKNLGGYPWTAVGYVRGDYDLDYYNGKLDRVNVDASGAVVAWAFIALGEFCDNNGREGFQIGSSDYIIKYFLGSDGAPYNQFCGVGIDNITGEQSYFSSIESTNTIFPNLKVFNTTCRIFPRDTANLYNGRYVSRYQFKCDLTIDYTGLWSLDPLEVRGCSDDKRKIGILVNILGSKFDADVTVDSNFNRFSGNRPDGESVSFNSGKLKFSWDNYFLKVPNRGSTVGTAGRVTYGYWADGNSSSATYQGASVVKTVIFSFSTPKSENKNIFYWDPAINVNSSPYSSPLFGMILAILCAMILF